MTDTPETESATRPSFALPRRVVCDKPARKLVERGTTGYGGSSSLTFVRRITLEWWAIGVHVEKYGAWWPEWPNPPATERAARRTLEGRA